MRQLLIATHNQAKFQDFNLLLKKLPFQTLSLDETEITQVAEEHGETFAENSLFKAKYYANISGLLTLADDGGLEIPFLGNMPGVHTRRWESDEPLTDEQLVEKILTKLAGTSEQQRQAVLRTVVTVFDPESGEYRQAEGKIDGIIVTEPKRPIIAGYPVRSVFYVSEQAKLLGDFTKSEKEKYNHRRPAIETLKPWLLTLNT